MNQFEQFALGQFLTCWPENWEYQRVISELKSENTHQLISTWETYDVYNYEDVATFIDDLRKDLERNFIPKHIKSDPTNIELLQEIKAQFRLLSHLLKYGDFINGELNPLSPNYKQ